MCACVCRKKCLRFAPIRASLLLNPHSPTTPNFRTPTQLVKGAHGLQRVACVDWDVHHGNGTQKGFEKDPDLFFGSSHQMPCYPGTGSPKEKGVAANVVNVGLKPGSGSKEFRAAWSKPGSASPPRARKNSRARETTHLSLRIA